MKTRRYLDTYGDVLLTLTGTSKGVPITLPLHLYAAQEAVMDGGQTTQLIIPSRDGNINVR